MTIASATTQRKRVLVQRQSSLPSIVRKGAGLLLLLALSLLADRSQAFLSRTAAVKQPSFAHPPSYRSGAVTREASPSSSTAKTTKLGLFPKEMVKLAAPLTTKGVAAFPMVMASLALEQGNADVVDHHVVGSVGIGMASNLLASATTSAPTIVEAEILNDISHVALDLFTLLGSPSLVAVRLAAVVGRVLIMAADYLPDHVVLPEEFVFQLFMLGVAWVGLVKSTLPVALSNLASNSVSLRDGKAYVELFAPAGVTWAQFKALSVYALDWVDVAEGETITSDEQEKNGKKNSSKDDNDDDDYVYWLYRGQAVVHSRGKEMHDIVRSKSANETNASPAMGLLGELSWSKRSNKNGENNSKASTSSSSSSSTDSSYPGTTVTAGNGGATLLRIHKSNVSKLMKDDDELSHAIRDLMFQGIQDKLAAQLALRV